MGKRFYWLKMRENFFAEKPIKKLRTLQCGDTGIIIYLKMQLIAMTNDGVLLYSGIGEDFADDLALEIDEDAEMVKCVVDFLIKYGLLEKSNDNDFYLPAAVENVGAECSSAERVRRCRAKAIIEKALQCNADVTDKALQNDENVTPEIREEEIRDIESLREKKIKKKREASPHEDEDVDQTDEREESDLSCVLSDGDQSKRPSPIRSKEIIEAWNGLGLSPLTTLRSETKRYAMLSSRLKEFGADSIFTAIRNIEQSSFLKGHNDRGWIVTFDWLVRPNNFPKVLEGQYADRPTDRRPQRNSGQGSSVARIREMLDRGEFSSAGGA